MRLYFIYVQNVRASYALVKWATLSSVLGFLSVFHESKFVVLKFPSDGDSNRNYGCNKDVFDQ